jgi:hypothetical protein
MRKVFLAVSVSGLATLASPLAVAQARDTATAREQAAVAFAQLRVDQRVRIRLIGSGVVEGSVAASSSTLVTLRTADGTIAEISPRNVDSRWVRGSHARTGALVGGAVDGLVAGSALGGTSTRSPSLPPEALLLAVGGGVLVGRLVGSAFPNWELWVP